MKTRLFMGGILLGAVTFLGAATNDPTTTLQRGLFEEEANQNLGAAIQAYQSVANQFDKDRKLAATAIFRLGECYRKQGNTNDAAVQYQRILREFSDQPTLVALSRQNLTVLGSAPPQNAVPVLSDAARQEQKRLLEEEIKLVQKQLEEQQKQMQVGRAAPGDLLPTERELLQLKRQIAVLDSGLAAPITATQASAPVASDAARQEQKRLLQEEITLVEKQLEAQQKQVQMAAVPPSALLPTQRDLLHLKRQIAALDAGLPVSIAAPETVASAAPSEADEVRRIQALIKDSPDLIDAPLENGLTLLQSAAQGGKLAVVKALLESGATVDGLQQPGLTPLHLAADNGHKAVVDLLLSKGAKANAQSESGVTPLHLAARKGYEAVAKALLAAGAPVNAQATTDRASAGRLDLQLTLNVGPGKTPLHLAANAGYSGMIELLLAKGADVNAEDGDGRTPLSYAAQKPAILQLLLAAHANPNGGRVNLPLALAAKLGDVADLKLLLASGADPNTNAPVNFSFNTRGNSFPQGGNCTPLFLAVNQRHADAAKELVRCKADPNGTTPNRVPLLHEALADAPTLEVLLEAGADANESAGGMPLLLQAVADRGPRAVELLLAHHAQVNATDRGGQTPLQAAAGLGLKPIAEVLLKAGAAVNAKDKNGETPLHAAVRYKNLEVADLLLANKADPNAKNNSGWTPLHLAVSDNQRQMAELLLANRADPNQRNKDGQTPLDFAKSMAQQPGGGTAFPARMPLPAGAGTAIPGQPPSVPANTQEQESKPETMADLLRRHGALDDLPHLDQVGVRRSSSGFSQALFTKGTQDWSQFSLLELLAVEYRLLAAGPDRGGGSSFGASALFGDSRLPFPDMAHVHISRPSADLKSWQDQVVDLTQLVESGDCAKDVRLRWGDVVEVPEADHPLNEKWKGFSKEELVNLKKCLTRKVEIVVKGQTTIITLEPKITGLEGHEGATPNGGASPVSLGPMGPVVWEPTIYAQTPFWIRPVLLQSKLVLISSDLSRVKVTRRDPATGQKREWVVDCSKGGESTPNLWLQDGDRLEVPEKT